ncbi:MAG TPA: diadenylate cyclase CdaA [Candidatus Dormibacteraeota bacterium]|nr:diadenylate cyclase CdaA [Candidatus Dormibacteraeota bacterium]
MTGVLADMLHQLWITVSKLGPVEIIDVVVVTFFLYQLLRLVKGTQATQLLLGLIVLGILGFLSVQLHLVLLSWLFQNAASVIAIALIVLFQPELRRMLDQLGRVPHLGRPLARFNQQLFNKAVSDAIRAAERLSAKKEGALIAFEREVGLEDYAETGVRLNSEISVELLQTIFFPNSPLHDGAVLVRGTTVLAAGCLLPLPEEGSVRERLGTRHRAAIGLSLVSDALILVVSEETGGISIVENGAITRNLDPDGLRERVTGSLETTSSNGRKPSIGVRLNRGLHELARR